MPAGKFLVFLAIVVIVGWAIYSHRSDIEEQVGGVKQQVQIKTFTNAELAFGQAKYDEAIALYRVAINEGIEPDKCRSYFRIGESFNKMNKKPEALEAYRTAIKLYPESKEAEQSKKSVEQLEIELNK